MTTKIISHFA